MSKVEALASAASEYQVPEDWEVATLGDAVKESKRSLDPRDFPEEVFEYYSIPAYQDGGIPIQERGSAIGSQKLLVEPGTVLFGKLNPRVPKVWHVTSHPSSQRRIASTEFIPLKAIDGRIDDEFLYYLSWSDIVMGQAKGLVSGSTPSRQRVDPRSFLALSIPLPPLEEQRGIASVLRALHQAKAATERVLGATRELKRSLMRHLFNYGPIPIQRAEDIQLKETGVGTIPDEWELRRFADFASTTSGGTPSRERADYYGGGIPWVKSGELNDGVVRTTGETLTPLGLSNSNAKLFPPGTLLIALYGATAGKVGILEIEAATNQAVCAIFPDKDKADPRFLFYALAHRRGALLGERYGGAQPNISQTVLRSFSIPLPPLKEQRLIAGILSAVDAKIDAEASQREALGSIFDALLRDLMTGRRRVTQPQVA